MKYDENRAVNDHAELKALRLVIMKTVGDVRRDLISLALHAVIASGDDLAADDSVPVVTIGEEDNRAAVEFDGGEWEGGWPGWERLISHIERKLGAK